MYFNIQYSYTHSKLSHQKEWPFRVLVLALPVVGANNSSGTPELKMMLFCAPRGLAKGRWASEQQGRLCPKCFLTSTPHFPSARWGKCQPVTRSVRHPRKLTTFGPSSSDPWVVNMRPISHMQAVSQYYHGFHQCALPACHLSSGFRNEHLRRQMPFFSLGCFSLTFFVGYLSNRCDHFFAWSEHQPMASIARHRPAELIPGYGS